MAFDELEWVHVEAEFIELSGGGIWDKVEDAAWAQYQRERQAKNAWQRAQYATLLGRMAHRQANRDRYAKAKERAVAVRCCSVCRSMFSLSQVQRLNRVRYCSRSCASRDANERRDAKLKASQLLRVHDKTQSLKDWAASQGMAYATVRSRILHFGMTSKEAVTTPVRKAQQVTIGGQTQTIVDWAKHYGILYTTVHMRMKVYGMSAEEALTKPLMSNTEKMASQKRTVTIDGETRTLREWAAHYDVSVSLVHQRVQQGMAIEDALRQGRKNQRLGQQMVTVDGVTRSIKEWFAQSGVSARQYYKRLERGWSQQDALTRPTSS